MASLGTWVRLIAWGLVAVWVVWWVGNLRRGRMEHGALTWVPALEFLSGDFLVSIDHVARIRAAGGDPYGDDWICRLFGYPPTVPLLFGWVTLMTPRAAAAVWTVALAGLAGLGAWAARATRRRLGLSTLPFPLILAATLYSAPFLLAAERGQCDLLVLPWLLAGCALLRTGTRRSEWLAGAAFAMAAWVKYYPGLVLVGLLAGRRWRSVVGFVAAGLAVGLADPVGVAHSLRNCATAFGGLILVAPGEMLPSVHSLSLYWPALWSDTVLWRLGRLPGTVAAAGMLLPYVAWVSHRVARGRRGAELSEAYYLWVVAAATFLPRAAGDYNLVFLVPAVLAAWDARDRPAVQVLLGCCLLALQPFRFDVSGRVLFLLKLGGLLATGWRLAAHASDDPAAPRLGRAPHRRLVRRASVGRTPAGPGWG
jgi:hypothetical protein